jgi:hypothetical protein
MLYAELQVGLEMTEKRPKSTKKLRRVNTGSGK